MAKCQRQRARQEPSSSSSSIWSPGTHALARIGSETEKVVRKWLKSCEPFNLFRKQEDEDLTRLAEAFLPGWTDAEAAKVVEAFAKRTSERGEEVDLGSLSRWIRLHRNDSEAVHDCLD